MQPDGKTYILSISELVHYLREAMAYYYRDVTDISVIDTVKHEVDCYIYGTAFEERSKDVLTDLFDDCDVPIPPSTVRAELRNEFKRRVYRTVEATLSFNRHSEYVITWLHNCYGEVIEYQQTPLDASLTSKEFSKDKYRYNSRFDDLCADVSI